MTTIGGYISIMFYVTYSVNTHEQTLAANLFDLIYTQQTAQPPIVRTINHTYTFETETITPMPNLQASLDTLLNTITHMVNSFEYHRFKIPKATGGFREICAPNDELKAAQRLIVGWMQTTCRTLAHDAAYAYISGRSTKDACAVHQNNKSKWMLKIDLKDFFPSCTGAFVFAQLKKIYPYCLLSDDSLRELLRFCLLNNALPQGAPTSPIITNTIMIPYDFAIKKTLQSYNGVHYVYTRYADDLLISSKIKFNPNEVVRYLEHTLPNNLKIKQEKTRFGSTAGRNWNLGLMLNKDNDITIGYREKQRLRAMVNALLNDYTRDIIWSAEDKNHAQGKLAYLKYIEPAYYDGMISKYETKYGVQVKDALRIL